MSLPFSVVPVAGKQGKYRAIAQPGDRIPYERFVARVQERVSVSPSDVEKVLKSVVHWILECALDGRECELGELGSSRLGLRGTFETPSPERVAHEEVQVTLSWKLSSKLVRKLNRRAGEIELEQVQPKNRQPVIVRVTDTFSKGKKKDNAWHAGGILHVYGDELSCDTDRPDEGVFLTLVGSGESVRVQVYQRAAIKNIVCQVPAELAGAGALRLEVRRRPRPNLPEPLIGKFSEFLEEMPGENG